MCAAQRLSAVHEFNAAALVMEVSKTLSGVIRGRQKPICRSSAREIDRNAYSGPLTRPGRAPQQPTGAHLAIAISIQ